MSEHVPTVRVVDPNDPDDFIVINRSDLGPRHKLWGTPPADLVIPDADTAAAEKAALAERMVATLMAGHLGTTVDEWSALGIGEQIGHMRDAERMIAEANAGVSPPSPAASPARDPLDHDGDGRKGGSLPGLTVGKGPGGRWFVKRGREIVTGPFASEAEAESAKAREV